MDKILKNFFVFEGLDGSGTTTQLELLSEFLSERDISHRTDCEPTKGAIGQLIRQVLASKYNFLPYTIAALFTADRNEHIFGKDGIKEMTDKGSIIISDRYFFSTLAYQSELDSIETTNHLNVDFPLPEVLFFFDIDADIAYNRINSRGKEKEIYENIQYLEKMTKNYNKILNIYKDSKMKIVRLDATKSIDELQKEIQNYFLENIINK